MLTLEDITKTYDSGQCSVSVLKGVSVDIAQGEACALTGASGSGKTTLMNIIGLLDRPDQGKITFEGRSLENISDDEAAQLRNERIGFVFQAFHLLGRLSALANVSMPLIYRGMPKRERQERAAGILDLVARVTPSDENRARRTLAAQAKKPATAPTIR